MPDSEFITNFSQVETVAADDFPSKPHDLKGLKKRNGKTPKVLVNAMSVGGHDDYLESCRIYRDGVYQGQNLKDDDAKLIYWATSDPGHNRLWKDVDEAIAQIRTWPLPVKAALKNAINEVNSLQPDEVVEGNSEGDQEGSPSSDSASTSASGT